MAACGMRLAGGDSRGGYCGRGSILSRGAIVACHQHSVRGGSPCGPWLIPAPSVRLISNPSFKHELFNFNMAFLVAEHSSPQHSTTLISSPIVCVLPAVTGDAGPSYPPPFLISSPINSHAKINSPSLRGLSTITFFPEDLN